MMGVMFGIMTGLAADLLSKPWVYEVYAAPVKVEPRVVQLEVIVNWTPERIEKEIRDTFPEAPERALAIFQCESSLKPTAKSHTNDHGIAQINATTWHETALDLGLTEYKTDVKQNLEMARFIYEEAGNSFSPWVCDRKV